MRAPSLFRLAAALAAVAAALALAGCGKSAPTRFYAFSPASQAVSAKEPCVSVGVGPIEVPSYLDRRDMVVREGENRLKLAEMEQWAEPLKDGLTRVLAENLQSMMCARPIAVYPWPSGVSPDYQVTVQVQRFDGEMGKQTTLKATWAILNKEGDLAVWKSFSASRPTGADSQAMASAMSGLAAELAADVARSLPAAGAAKPGQAK